MTTHSSKDHGRKKASSKVMARAGAAPMCVPRERLVSIHGEQLVCSSQAPKQPLNLWPRDEMHQNQVLSLQALAPAVPADSSLFPWLSPTAPARTGQWQWRQSSFSFNLVQLLLSVAHRSLGSPGAAHPTEDTLAAQTALQPPNIPVEQQVKYLWVRWRPRQDREGSHKYSDPGSEQRDPEQPSDVGLATPLLVQGCLL